MSAPRLDSVIVVILLGALSPVAASSQGGFVAGARTIVTLDFANEPVGDVPKGLRPHFGKLDVVEKDGVHMLRASSPSDFVLRLPEDLPRNFTIEFDLIPKACCNPVDLMVEGVISGSRSSVSAQIEWDADHFAVVGGNPEMFQMDMPAEIAALLPSARTKVALSFEDETIKMYTNGTRVYTLTNRKFVRRRVLHISLGGQDEDQHAVYLASVRVADLAPSIVASNEPQAGPRTASPLPSQPNAVTPPGANASSVPDGFRVTVSPGTDGPVVSWSAVATASGYTVNRYKVDDVACCSTSSGRGWLSGLSWQDTPLPASGQYVYLVLAATPAGQLRGQATLDYVQPATLPTLTPPIAASLNIVPDGFPVTVTMGTNGPLVSWTPLPNTSRYAVDRAKIGDSCCGSSSGRTVATSPWQDAPLPASGTYEYKVTAYTPNGQVFGFTQFGFRMPGGTSPSTTQPMNGVLVSPNTTATQIPLPSGATTATSPTAPAPRTGTVPLNPNQTAIVSSQPTSGGAPAGVRFAPLAPLAVRIYWDWPANASQYDIVYSVRRAALGTSNWTPLTPTPLKDTFVFEDVVPDYRLTYTYIVTATHPNGTTGETAANYTPPAPEDPKEFTAQVTGPGEVLLTWSPYPAGQKYLLTGPGAGNGVVTDGLPVTGGAHKHTYVVKGLPAGTHTWHVATSYQPGGVLTQPTSWPVASATLGVTTGRYMITVESIRANNGAIDDIGNLDGVGNEIYVNAEIVLNTPGATSQAWSKSSAIYGDITSFAPPTRVQAGQGRPNGGIGTGDVISPIWEPPQPGATGYTRLVLWQGQLTDGVEVVQVIPSIWEWDSGYSLYSATWAKFMRQNAVALDLSQRTASGEISNVMYPEPSKVPSIGYGAAAFQVFESGDRPIGVAREWPWYFPDDGYSLFYPVSIRVTQSVAEAAIAGAYGPPGMIPIRFVDHAIGSGSTKTIPEYGNGDYTLNLRIERIP